ncbi:hypothetical protein BO86DRAFT_105626 [Aspergillus japonicus CBS 114.51]|uniref:Uncharacterized protein n=2 Tax=Aspergillus TaxID=5052 RepID=A0A2V5H5P2_ASPV1|nr:hypothetical protein BO86DRAFT_105626 [Aspergillus japonicus CBS 114.51]PYI18811.1 hypothetical protein BO99DRAFT_157371 [Aspergillus violaceofuscus CBS 115571]RAH81050.1 hypothetical protein BO86DRAFT_105626 [Aspergillus japonicus CBS 114.51]
MAIIGLIASIIAVMTKEVDHCPRERIDSLHRHQGYLYLAEGNGGGRPRSPAHRLSQRRFCGHQDKSLETRRRSLHLASVRSGLGKSL